RDATAVFDAATVGFPAHAPDGAVGAVVRRRPRAPWRALLRHDAPRRPDDGEVPDAVHVRVVDHRGHCGRTRPHADRNAGTAGPGALAPAGRLRVPRPSPAG